MTTQEAVTRRPAKYRNAPTVVDGIRFASKAEAKRYTELKLLERAGEISDLKLQTRWPLAVEGVKITTYVSDFDYWTAAKFLPGAKIRVIEDVKGVSTPVFKLKAKLFEAIHGRKITLIGRAA